MSLNTLLVSEDENPNLVSPAVQVAACHVIRLFCTSLLKSDQEIKTIRLLHMYDTFLMLDSQ